MKQEKFEQIQGLLRQEQDAIITFFVSRLPLKNNSNLFLRDLQVILHSYLENKGYKPGYSETEMLCFHLLGQWEADGAVTRVETNTWRVNTLVKKAQPETETAGV